MMFYEKTDEELKQDTNDRFILLDKTLFKAATFVKNLTKKGTPEKKALEISSNYYYKGNTRTKQIGLAIDILRYNDTIKNDGKDIIYSKDLYNKIYKLSIPKSNGMFLSNKDIDEINTIINSFYKRYKELENQINYCELRECKYDDNYLMCHHGDLNFVSNFLSELRTKLL